MKKFFMVLLSMLIGGISLSAQERYVDESDTTSILTPLDSLNILTMATVYENVGKYKLYPTENMWTFLKLNTQTGQVYQLQFSVKDDNYGEVVVNGWRLNFDDLEPNGRYELYPTQNMYNFLMLDKETGAVWQVQWSMKAENRGIIRISDYED